MNDHGFQLGAFGAPGFGYDCIKCEDEGRERGEIDEWASGFIVCPECGNKRCPKATWHLHDCTGSNAPGQHGSVYGDGYIGNEVTA